MYGEAIVSGSVDNTIKVWEFEESFVSSIQDVKTLLEKGKFNGEIGLLTLKLFDYLKILDDVTEVACHSRENKSLNQQLEDTTRRLRSLQLQYPCVCSQLRKNITNERIRERDAVKQSLMESLANRSILLQEWLVSYDKKLELQGFVNELLDDVVVDENYQYEENFPNRIRRQIYTLIRNFLLPFLSELNDFNELDKEFECWKGKDITWMNIFLMSPDLQKWSDKAKKHVKLKSSIDSQKVELEKKLCAILSELKSYYFYVKTSFQQCEKSIRQIAEEDYRDMQNQIQHLQDLEKKADNVRLLIKEKTDLQSSIKEKDKLLYQINGEIKFLEEESKKNKLKEKQMEIEKELSDVYKKLAERNTRIEAYLSLLQENYPDLLDDCVRDVAFGSSLRKSVVDNSTSFDDYKIESAIVIDKVFPAFDKLQQKCVIKKLIGVGQFKKEVERVYNLHHPLIVPIRKVFIDRIHPGDICFIEMPFYEKGNLRNWVNRMQNVLFGSNYFNEDLEFVEIQTTFRQVTQAVAHIHAKGVVHRDIKPENVLLSFYGRIGLCDFGISSDFGKSTSVTTTVVAGTPFYMAPEAMTEWRKHPTALDMWSLGCMMFELLLQIIPKAFPSAYSKGVSLDMLTSPQFNSPNLWTGLTDYFTLPHMKGYVRICSQLLSFDPKLRPTAHELLLDDILRVKVHPLDPLTKCNVLCSSLKSLKSGDIHVMNIPESADVCKSIFQEFEKLKDIHRPVRVFDEKGYEKPLSEVLELFFNEIMLPGRGFFTQHLDADTTDNEENSVLINKAFLPRGKGNMKHFQIIGKIMAKCLLEGIRVPLNLNSCCLGYMLGRNEVPQSIDEALSYISETSSEELTFYRNILRDLPKQCLEVGTLLGSTSEEFVNEDNKINVFIQSIWRKLVELRRDSLDQLTQGFRELKRYDDLKFLSGKELQLMFFGNDFINLDDIQEQIMFTVEGWHNMENMERIQLFLKKWISDVSELTLRILLLRCLGTFIYTKNKNIFVVSSYDDQLHISEGGIIQIPETCTNYEEFADLWTNELFFVHLKSDTEKKNQLTQKDYEMITGAMSEIRAGGWYKCPNGHLYAVGECGGPMESRKCPECGTEIGGQNHRLANGNKHAGIDGSKQPAWPQH